MKDTDSLISKRFFKSLSGFQTCLNMFPWEFPSGLVVRILGFHCHDPGSIPGWRTEILQAQKEKRREKKNVSSFLSIMYMVQTNRGRVIFHAKNNLRSSAYFKSGKTHLRKQNNLEEKKTHKYIKMFNSKVITGRDYPGVQWLRMCLAVPGTQV